MENDTSGTERASKLKAWRISPMAIAFGLVALLLAWQWYDGGNRIGALRDELAQRVRESESDSRDARLAARQAQEAAREAQAKVAQIELKLDLGRSEEHTSELQSLTNLVCRLL